MLAAIRTHYIEPIRSFNRAARLFLLMMLIYGIIYSGWQLFFNFYILQNGFNRDFLGLVNSLPFAASFIFGIPLGRLSDRIGRKASLIIGFLFYSITLLMEITFRQSTLIVISAFLSGVFNMLFIISQAPLMVKLSDKHNRTMLFSLNYGLQTIAGAVGSLFAGQLPALFGTILRVNADSATAYQAVLVVTILLGMTALIPLWIMKEPRSPQPVPVNATVQDNASNGLPSKLAASGLTAMTLKVFAPQVLLGFGAAILIPYMNVFFKYSFNISDSLLGISLCHFVRHDWRWDARRSTPCDAAGRQSSGYGGNPGQQSRIFIIDGLCTHALAFCDWIFNADRVDEYGFALVYRLLHGTHARTSTGICEQRFEFILEYRLGSRTVCFRRGATELRVCSALCCHGRLVFLCHPSSMAIF